MKKYNDPFGFNKAINWEKLEDPEVLEELEKISAELLREALEDQEIPIRRLGVKVSEFSDLEGQSSITSYF